MTCEASSGYGVMMGSSQAIKGEGICKEFVRTLKNIEIVEDFLLLDLGSVDVILYMKWLESFGGMQVSWKSLTMRFTIREVTMILQGNPSLSASLILLKAM